MGWFKDLMNTPAIVWYKKTEGTPKTIVHNHYYITVDNRVIKVGEKEFREFIKNKMITNKTELLESR